MNNKTSTPSHHEVGKIAKKKATESHAQPSIKRWLTKTSLTTQPNNGAESLGACIANTANINNDTVSFENKIRTINEKYNDGLIKFKKTD